MDEYLKTLLEQIRCKKARPYVKQEFQDHIEDQIEANMQAGMDREQAEREAVRDMGDPVETGISLDSVHRPQVAWKLLGIIVLISIAGVLIHAGIAGKISENAAAGSDRYVFHVVIGLAVMMILYLLDYTVLARFSKIIAVILLFACLVTLLGGYQLNGARYFIVLPGGRGISMQTLMLFYVPIYGAILYKYHGWGYKGLMRAQYIKMMPDDFSGIMTKGGTILGSSRQPFKLMGEPTEDGLDKVKSMKDTYKKLKLDCLCVLGGNGSQKTANLLSEEGLNVIGLPKTIDNDLWGTDMTFGFQSAVDVATQTIDCIHTTAASHNRIFIVEIMGHKVGWITLHAGIAGGADVILIPEIPYDIKKVYEVIDKRTKNNKGFTIVAVAEGAISKEVAELPKKKRKEAIANSPYPSVAYEMADKLKEFTTQDIRIAIPGHTQRGGSPCPYDRVISSRFGAKAAELIKAKDFGKLVVFKDNKVTAIPLSESAGKLKYVSPDDDTVLAAKTLGISFGD